MALSISRPMRELEIISLVDIILLLLIFALMIQFGSGGSQTRTLGQGEKKTTLKVSIVRIQTPDRPEAVQVRVIYNTDTNRVDFPPIQEFVSMSYSSFAETEAVHQTIRYVDTYLNDPLTYPIEGIEVDAHSSVPFKLVDLFVRKFSAANQLNFSLAYRRGGAQ